MLPPPTRPRRIAAAIALAIAATFVAAGCSDDGGTSAPPAPTDDGPVEVREVDQPTADDGLTEAMGEDGATLVKAGCSFGTYELGEPEHVDTDRDLESPSFPPTSGHHFEDWAPFGEYDEPVPDGNVVHNLEHGGVVAWTGVEVDEQTVDALAGQLDDGEKWILAPRPDIEGLFVAAWGVGLTCPPTALEQLGPDATAAAVDTWFETVESTGSEAEKDVPAYAGAMKEPAPVRDISAEAPF